MLVTKVVPRLLQACLAVIVVAGLAREWRLRELARPLVAGLHGAAPGEVAPLLAARVAERFAQVKHEGPIGVPWPGPLQTSGAPLLVGGACGDAAIAMGAVLDTLGIPFRILHVNVQDYGASHIMLEVLSQDGRWLLADPLDGTMMHHPVTGRIATLEELRSLRPEDAALVDPRYRAGRDWSLFALNMRTNWTGLGPVGAAARLVLPRSTLEGFSLRAALIEPGYEVAALAAMLLCASALRRRRRETGEAGEPLGTSAQAAK